MRKLPQSLDGYFDVVTNLFFSFGYFFHKENLRLLASFYRVLKPQGHLIIHTLTDEILKASLYLHARTRNVFPTTICGKKYPGGKLLFSKKYDVRSQIFVSRWQVQIGKDMVPELPHPSRVKIYSTAEFRDMLKEAGFHATKFYRDFNQKEFDHYAEECIIHCRK